MTPTWPWLLPGSWERHPWTGSDGDASGAHPFPSLLSTEGQWAAGSPWVPGWGGGLGSDTPMAEQAEENLPGVQGTTLSLS